MPDGYGTLVKLLTMKEVADFIQVGLIWAQKLLDFRKTGRYPGGEMGIDRTTFWIDTPAGRISMPLQEAAQIAGVGGAASRPKPTTQKGFFAEWWDDIKYRVTHPIEALEKTLTFQPVRPSAGKDPQVASATPKAEDNPIPLPLQVVALTEAGKDRRQQMAIQSELALERLKDQRERDLKALDAQIERERLAVQAGLKNQEMLLRLQDARERRAHEWDMKILEAENRLRQSRQEHEQELETLDRKMEWAAKFKEFEAEQKAKEQAAELAAKAEAARQAREWGEYQRAYKEQTALLARDKALEAQRNAENDFARLLAKTAPRYTIKVGKGRYVPGFGVMPA
jgi:hypothetical protein